MARLTKEEQKIKKVFGEDMLKLCRELELTGLTEQGKSFNYDEIENLLFDILSTSFAPSNSLSDVLSTIENREKFKAFVYTKVGERGYRLGPEVVVLSIYSLSLINTSREADSSCLLPSQSEITNSCLDMSI